MAGTVRHMMGVDQATGAGMDVTFGDTTYTFSPLRFVDYGEIIKASKSWALGAYLSAVEGKSQPMGERIRDINGICCRMTLADDFSPANFEQLPLRVKLSLQRKHPEITDDEVAALLDDNDTRGKVIEIQTVLEYGPLDLRKQDSAGGEDQPVNPTSTTTK